MGFNKFEEDVNVHQTLGDYPNIDNGITADKLKEILDGPANKLKAGLNQLIENINATTGASNIGADKIYDDDASDSNLQAKLELLKNLIDGTTLGQIPDDSITGNKIANESITENKINNEYREKINNKIINKIKDVSTFLVPTVQKKDSERGIDKVIINSEYFISTVNTTFENGSELNEIKVSGDGLTDGYGTVSPILKIKKKDGSNFIMGTDMIIKNSSVSNIPNTLSTILKRTTNSTTSCITFSSEFYFIYDFQKIRTVFINKRITESLEYSNDGVNWENTDASTVEGLIITARYIRATCNSNYGFRYLYFTSITGQYPGYKNEFTLNFNDELISGQIFNMKTQEVDNNSVTESYLNGIKLGTNLVSYEEYRIRWNGEKFEIISDIVFDIELSGDVAQIDIGPDILKDNNVYFIYNFADGINDDIMLYDKTNKYERKLMGNAFPQCALIFIFEKQVSTLVIGLSSATCDSANVIRNWDLNNLSLILEEGGLIEAGTKIQIRRL